MPYDSICAYVDLDRDPARVLSAVVELALPETIVHFVASVPAPVGEAVPEVHARLRASAEARLRSHVEAIRWLDGTPPTELIVVDGLVAAVAEYANGRCDLLILDGSTPPPDCTSSVLLAR